MTRKNLLQGLMGDKEKSGPPAPPDGRVDPARPRYGKGAIGAVSKSIADLKSRSIIDIDPFQIEAGGVQDRLDYDEVEHQSLMASLKEYGQQVPVLVRPHPDQDGHYQIVYGRRRVLALRDLGQPVKAMIRDLDDRALIVAQGQENTVRRDLSFIERANFARQMSEAGYDRKVICDAVNVDKTVISRMMSIAETLPVEVIELIGAAPGTGRDRWLKLSRLWEQGDYEIDDAAGIIAACNQDSSDARFEILMTALERHALRPRSARVSAEPIRAGNGKVMGEIRRRRNAVTITLKPSVARGFETWLADRIEDIHRDWLEARDDQER